VVATRSFRAKRLSTCSLEPESRSTLNLRHHLAPVRQTVFALEPSRLIHPIGGDGWLSVHVQRQCPMVVVQGDIWIRLGGLCKRRDGAIGLMASQRDTATCECRVAELS
jgi:hypothetical protein